MTTTSRARVDHALSSARFTRGLAATVWIALGLTLLLFLNKLRQTPSWALQHSRQTQEEVGYWVMALVALFLVALLSWAMAASARRSLRDQLVPYVSTLHDRLAQARASGDIAIQVGVEDELRQLERHRGATAGAAIVPAVDGSTTTTANGPSASTTSAAVANATPVVAADRYDQLAKVKRLFDDGVLDRDEYERERQRILARD